MYVHVVHVSVVFYSLANVLHCTPRICVIPYAYNKRVTRVSQFTTMEQEREREIERFGKRQALYTCLDFPSGFRRKWPSSATFCGVRDTVVLSLYRRCASTSFYVASWLAAFRAFRSHVLLFLLHRRERRTMCNSFTIKNRRCCARTL